MKCDPLCLNVREAVLWRLSAGFSLHTLSVALDLPVSKVSMLGDVKHGRWEHVSSKALRDLARRLDVPVPKRKDTLTLRLDPTRCYWLTTEEMRNAVYWEADHVKR